MLAEAAVTLGGLVTPRHTSDEKKPDTPGGAITRRPVETGSTVARAGIEPATFRFSGGRSYQLSYLAGRHVCLAV